MSRYYIYEYIVDTITGIPTNHEGQMVAFVEAESAEDALIKTGYADPDKYGAMPIGNLETFADAINKERELLNRFNRQIKKWIKDDNKQTNRENENDK